MPDDASYAAPRCPSCLYDGHGMRDGVCSSGLAAPATFLSRHTIVLEQNQFFLPYSEYV